MKELGCALALILVGLVSATPYGYGVKGGAGAGAGAATKAVAGSGAISSISGLPLSIPSGAGFSGSYSKSASSSFSSSSASSSSGSFSFSGSGGSGLSGYNNDATGNGCATGSCQNGAKDVSGSFALGGSGANGLQGYNAANTVAGASAGALAGTGYAGSSAPCATGDCSKKYGSTSDNLSAQVAKETDKSEADALSEVSSTDNFSNTKCKSGQCGSSSQTETPTDNDSNAKCSSGQCGSASASGAAVGTYGSNNKCTTGHCEPSSPDTLNAPYESDSKCASGQCGPGAQVGIPSDNIGSAAKCTSGQCGLAIQSEPSSTGYGSDGKCSSGLCGISSQPESPTYNNRPDSNCASGACGFASQPTTPQVHQGSDSKPSSYHDESTVHPEIPSTSYGHPVATSPSIDSGKCSSGNCSPNPFAGPTETNNGPYDIQVTGSKSAYNSNKDTSNLDKTSTGSVGIKSDCFLGNCGPSSVPHTQSTYKAPVSNPYPGVEKPNDGSPNYGYNPTSLGGVTAGYNKPASYLTTPKLQANYIHSTGPSSYNTPGSYSHSVHGDKPCSAGDCGIGQPSTPFATSGSYSSNYASSKYPNQILPSGSSGTPCSSGNCALNVHDYSKTPGYVSVPDNQGPASPSIPSGPASCISGSCAPYPYPSNAGYGSVTIGATAPNPSYGQTTSQVPTGSGVPGFPFVPTGPSPVGSQYPSVTHSGEPTQTPISSSSSCKTPDCSPYHTPTPGVTQSVPSVVGIVKPTVVGNSDEKSPPYTGGFGGPAGVLKPYENIAPSIPSNTYNKPTVPTSVYNPTGANSYHQPIIPTGAYSPTTSNSYNKPSAPTGTNVPTACSYGNCGTQIGEPAIPHGQSVPSHSSGGQVPHGPSISPSGTQAVAGALAGANAEAEGVAYTGGFGGPPGLLKPYDDGKLGSAGLINLPSSSGAGVPGSYGTSYNKFDTGHPVAAGGNAGVGTGAIAQAGAVAGASSGAVGGTYDHANHFGTNIHEQKGSSGCGGGCGSSTGGSYSGSNSFGLSSGQGYSKIGHFDGLSGGLASSGATAKSLAGAVSGANSFGTSGSFASSAATAHASAGAGVKGGYYG